MTTRWYWQRISKSSEYITTTSRVILPANRAAVTQFLAHWTTAFEDVPSGLQDAIERESIDGDSDNLFSKFEDYIRNEERRFKTVLRQLSYNIDHDSILYMFTAGNRPEEVQFPSIKIQHANSGLQYAIPLLCLLLERGAWIMNIATKSLVSPQEFLRLRDSIRIVLDEMWNRSVKLQC